jgi:hypothetical protein
MSILILLGYFLEIFLFLGAALSASSLFRPTGHRFLLRREFPLFLGDTPADCLLTFTSYLLCVISIFEVIFLSPLFIPIDLKYTALFSWGFLFGFDFYVTSEFLFYGGINFFLIFGSMQIQLAINADSFLSLLFAKTHEF